MPGGGRTEGLHDGGHRDSGVHRGERGRMTTFRTLLVALALVASTAQAQTPATRILVVPFENASNEPRLSWLNAPLTSRGQRLSTSRDTRQQMRNLWSGRLSICHLICCCGVFCIFLWKQERRCDKIFLESQPCKNRSDITYV